MEEQFPFLEFDDTGVKAVHFLPGDEHHRLYRFYCPYTGESNVNVDSPACLLPSTAAHELAHQRSIASEQECNFLAILACTTCGDGVRVLRLADGIHSSGQCPLPGGPGGLSDHPGQSAAGRCEADLTDNNAYWAQFQDTAVQKVSNEVYDRFLKGYGEEQGLQSYGTVVDLLVVYYRDAAV